MDYQTNRSRTKKRHLVNQNIQKETILKTLLTISKKQQYE